MTPSVPNEFACDSLPEPVRAFRPDWGVILGSGLGGFVESMEIEARIPFAEIEGMPVVHVPGQKGALVCGRIAGKAVVVAQGRVHLYEGKSSREVTANVRLFAALGVRRLLLTNAAGSVNSDFQPGTWMAITDHLNLTGASPLTGGTDFHDMSAIYSPLLRGRLLKRAGSEAIVLHEGVYAAVRGPQYETPAEIRMLRTLGADAVGMSTVLEAILAAALGMEVCGLSCLTNWGAGMSEERPAHNEVLRVGRTTAPELARLVGALMEDD